MKKLLLFLVAMTLALSAFATTASAYTPPVEDEVTSTMVDIGPGGSNGTACLYLPLSGYVICCLNGTCWRSSPPGDSSVTLSLSKGGSDDEAGSDSWQDPGGDGYPMCYLRDPFSGIWYWVRC